MFSVSKCGADETGIWGKVMKDFVTRYVKLMLWLETAFSQRELRKTKALKKIQPCSPFFFFRKLAVVLCLKSSYIQVFEDTSTSALITNEDKLFK